MGLCTRTSGAKPAKVREVGYNSCFDTCLSAIKTRFGRTLKLIHEFMRKLADSQWSDRFLRKNSIEEALAGYTRLLDEAAQSFQVGLIVSSTNLVLIGTTQLATLIDLHYTVGTFSQQNTEIEAAIPLQIGESPPLYEKNKTLDPIAQEPEIVESSVTTIVDISELTISPAELTLTSRYEEPITEISTDSVLDTFNDHYLPGQLSSLTLDDDHGVPLLKSLFSMVSHVFSSSGDTTSPR